LNVIADNALMLKVKSGDLDKLGLLFERYKRPLFGFFYRMTSDKVISEDLVQNLFLRILKYRHTYTGKGEFRTWAYHLARNILTDHWKKQQKQGFKSDISEWQDQLADHQAAEAGQQEEDIRLLNLALNELAWEKREVLILSRYQGLKYQEIAEIMQTTEGNIKVMVHRALAELKKNFEKISQQ
jgi:RNA polymerase sigma factor (sigma-70 family)